MLGALFAPTVTARIVTESAGGVSGARIGFAFLALLILGGALFTITRRNSIVAVMSLVATFFGLAAAYALLSAHFLAVLQVLVYAGAIMVLFIFVVMVLNRDEAEPWVWRGLLGKILLGVVPLAYLLATVGRQLVAALPERRELPPPSFGTVSEVGEILFTDYLFAFEAISILLIIAVVAAVVVARAHRQVEVPKAAEDSEGIVEETMATPPAHATSSAGRGAH
jgi:NADH-quinone oxidoreductase subunit J